MSNKNEFWDYFILCIVLAEIVLLPILLTYKVTMLGYILPIAVSIVAFTVAYLAIRDFFRQHG